MPPDSDSVTLDNGLQATVNGSSVPAFRQGCDEAACMKFNTYEERDFINSPMNVERKRLLLGQLDELSASMTAKLRDVLSRPEVKALPRGSELPPEIARELDQIPEQYDKAIAILDMLHGVKVN